MSEFRLLGLIYYFSEWRVIIPEQNRDESFKCQPHKMVKHTQTIRRLTNFLSVYDHFVGLAFKEFSFPNSHCLLFILWNQVNLHLSVKCSPLLFTPSTLLLFKKQLSRGVIKRCSENMQQNYRRAPVLKCDFNKAARQFHWSHASARQLHWNHTSALIFSSKFAAYFLKIFLHEHLWWAASVSKKV